MYATQSTAFVAQEIVRLCHAGLDSYTLRKEVFQRLQRAVPYANYWCATTDPAMLMFTGAVSTMDFQDVPAYLTNEFLQEDFNKFSTLATSRLPVATLKVATRGHLEESQRYREILEPGGLGDELRAVFRSGGAVWGAICLHRERRGQDYTQADVDVLAGIAPHLATGLRTALLLDAVEIASATEGPGLLLLADDLSIIAATPGAELLLDEVGDWPGYTALPSAVLAVVTKLRALERNPQAGIERIPRARLRTRTGRWLALHASRLTPSATAGQIAVIIERTTPNDVAPLVLQAYALTAREQEVAGLILKGRSTADIASTLCISTLTVQQHLKAVFEKVGVRSRREFVAQVFAHSYWPSIAAERGVAPDSWSPQ